MTIEKAKVHCMKENNEKEYYDIRFYKNTGTLIIKASDRYMKINMASNNITIRKQEEMGRILISASGPQKSEDFLVFYSKVKNSEETYQQLCDWQIEFEESRNNENTRFSITET